MESYHFILSRAMSPTWGPYSSVSCHLSRYESRSYRGHRWALETVNSPPCRDPALCTPPFQGGAQPTQCWLFLHENYSRVWRSQSSSLATHPRHSFSLLFFKEHNSSHTVQGLSLKVSLSPERADSGGADKWWREEGLPHPKPRAQTGCFNKINEEGNGVALGSAF